MISICITCKNRSKVKYHNGVILTLLPNLVDSLVKLTEHIPEEIELVVSDWMSDDWPLYEWLPEKVDKAFSYNIVKVKDKKFSRGKGRNIAFSFAKGDKILFLDTDMLITSTKLFDVGVATLDVGCSFFPICWSHYDHQHIDGWWRATGFGNFMASRKHLRKVGPWKEKYSWGGEDDDMFLRMSRTFPIIRYTVKSFCHQWHPEEKAYISEPKNNFWNRILRRK